SADAAGKRAPSRTPRALAWLNAKPTRSVVYVCFGSLTRFPHEQVAELGMGLADSGVNFVWGRRG
ncbi:Os06g0137650, partial [Oryza sativa Japonica Group]